MGDDGRRSRPHLADGCGEDRISRLPDELLHSILICLGSARAAARTTALSRRWRPLWTHLPELSLSADDDPAPPSSFADVVDAAHAASHLKRLSVSAPVHGHGTPANRIEPWLRFASGRVAGEVFLDLAPDSISFDDGVNLGEEEQGAVLELPACGLATKISLYHAGLPKLRLAGMFESLTELQIGFARMDARELSDLVSTQCPWLRKLGLMVKLVAPSALSIHSESLQSLFFVVQNTRRLQLVAPRLEDLTLYYLETYETRISAPKLATLCCYGKAFVPRQHQITDVGCRLGRLKISLEAEIIPLMKRFNEVDHLRLTIFVRQGIAGYQSFLDETNNFSRCEILSVTLAWEQHGFAALILQLFKCCNGIKKLSVHLMHILKLMPPCPLACPCHSVESSKIDDIVLSLVEEIEINRFSGSPEEMEFVSILSRCNAPLLKRLVITDTENNAGLTKVACQKVRSMCRPDLKVEL